MLRNATPEDAEAIGQIKVAAWRAAYQEFIPADFLAGINPADNLDSLRERLSAQGPEFTISVAETDKKVVAFSIIGKPRYPAALHTMELWALNVIPEYWQLGIGSKLVARAADYSKQHGFDSIELWCISGNRPAQLAYHKAGFVASGQQRSSSQLTGHPIHELHYFKML